MEMYFRFHQQGGFKVQQLITAPKVVQALLTPTHVRQGDDDFSTSKFRKEETFPEELGRIVDYWNRLASTYPKCSPWQL